jgi:hypothetical protein
MNTEIVTDPLAVEDLWFDLRSNIALLKKMQIASVNCLFGYSWGNFIYPGDWHEIPITLNGIEETIIGYQKMEYGQLGDDNLYISIPDLAVKLSYTYETDIHLAYAGINHFVEQVKNRWDSDQWLAHGQYRPSLQKKDDIQ